MVATTEDSSTIRVQEVQPPPLLEAGRGLPASSWAADACPGGPGRSPAGGGALGEARQCP